MQQHWVPESYLLRWCDPDTPAGHEPYVWVFNKDTRQGKAKAPKNIFKQPDLYTDPRRKGSERYWLEAGLSKIENEFVRVRDERIEKRQELGGEDKGILAVFASLMFARTPPYQEHARQPWQRMVEIARDMQQSFSRMSPEQRRKATPTSIMSDSGEDEPSISIEEAEEAATFPAQTLMAPLVKAMAPILAKMPCAVLVTRSDPGFITSDSPCVHFDPEAWKRPPAMRGGMKWRTLEVTLPLTPGMLLMFGWKLLGDRDYVDVSPEIVDVVNATTRWHCDERFIVRRNRVREAWFDAGTPPQEAPAGAS
jgi:Protein of unknown function (DUF4238)